MGTDEKDGIIVIRINKQKKKYWRKICSEKKISMTSLIINSAENRILDDERRIVLAFIEKQDNLFVKIETNINQIAKIANAQKFISAADLQDFSNKLSEIADLKIKQNDIFIKIYSLLGQ
ncbi:plasmid mobilization relaxosome protein MobC [Chryseobacterium sp. KACC 21268]|nr:plasmid mobilization relaxosome protein MobC [Chryseobacterium sp. KACC 21268]